MENNEKNPGTPENKPTGEPNHEQKKKEQEARRLRFVFRQRLVTSFSKTFQKCTEDFTWQDKADFMEAMIQYATLLLKDRKAASDFNTEKIIKVYRAKLQPAIRLKLFRYFEKDLWATGLDFLVPEVFKDVDNIQWEWTEEEWEQVLLAILHYLSSDFEMHLIFGKRIEEDETELKSEELAGIPGLKGRMPRSAGDNVTRLSQEQTALFVELLRFGRIVLGDRSLNAKQAGIAFHILTGYSADGLRMKLNKQELSKLKTQANLTEIHNTLTRLTLQIENDLKELKKSKGS